MEKKKKIIIVVVAALGVLFICCGVGIISAFVFREELNTDTVLEKYLGIQLDEEKEVDVDVEDNDKEVEKDEEKDVKLTPEEALEKLKAFKDEIENSSEYIEGYIKMNMDASYLGDWMNVISNSDFNMRYDVDYKNELAKGTMNFVVDSTYSYDPSLNVSEKFIVDVFVNGEETYYKVDGARSYSDDLDLGIDTDLAPLSILEDLWGNEDEDEFDKIVEKLEYVGEDRYNNKLCYRYDVSDAQQLLEMLGDLEMEELGESFEVDFNKLRATYWIDPVTGYPVGVLIDIKMEMYGQEDGMEMEMDIEMKMSIVINAINEGVEIEIPRELR